MPAKVKNVDRPTGQRLEVYRDGGKQFRWRKVAKNNLIVSISGEGFRNHRFAITSARANHPNLPLFDLTKG